MTGNNRSALALAEHIAGNEDKFTQLMNEKAKHLKLSQSSPFLNATGMNNDTNKLSTTTAIEVAKLATQLVTDFPDVLNVTKLTSYQFTFKDTKVFNTNKMIYSLNKTLNTKVLMAYKLVFQLMVIIVLSVQQNEEILDLFQ